jgi:predicted permease
MWRRERDSVARELRYHFDKLVRDYLAEGMSAQEAERRARLEFGGVEQIEEEVRDVRGHLLDDLIQDLRYALRMMRRSPWFAAVAVASLALGIGANTAIFSLINAVMLRSLPVRDPHRLVLLTRLMKDTGTPSVVSYPIYEYFRNNLKSISGAAAEMGESPDIILEGATETVEAEYVDGAHFALLGVEPAAGRLLAPEDDSSNAASPAAVISYRYWQRRFSRSPTAIGKTLSVRSRVFTIVGVTPPGYQGTRAGRDPDITLPLQMMLTPTQRREVGLNSLRVLARLKPGVTVEHTNAEVQVLWNAFLEKIAAGVPAKDRLDVLRQRAAAIPAPDGFNPLKWTYSRTLMLLMGMVALVLLLACANLSSLLLARAAAREREVSVRLAIGAGRARLMRQFLAESLVLAARRRCRWRSG